MRNPYTQTIGLKLWLATGRYRPIGIEEQARVPSGLRDRDRIELVGFSR